MSQLVHTFRAAPPPRGGWLDRMRRDRANAIIHPDGHLQVSRYLSIWHIARRAYMSHPREV